MLSRSQSFNHATVNDGRGHEIHTQSDSQIGFEQARYLKASTDPYRRQQEAQELPSGTRKTPARAVFDDLTTAHSSITSGSARSRYRATKRTELETYTDEDSIPLDDLEPSFFLQSLPLPPLPAILSSSRYGDHSDARRSSDVRTADPATYQSCLSATMAGSLPPSSSLPDGSTIGNIYKHYARSDDDCYDHDSDHRITREGVSIPSEYTKSPEQLRPSALHVRKQRRVGERQIDSLGQPPDLALPDLPKPEGRRLTPSTSHGVTHSSSYGDTYNLLDISQNERHCSIHRLVDGGQKASLSRSKYCGDLRLDNFVPGVGTACVQITPQ